jgi:hypothetical protein
VISGTASMGTLVILQIPAPIMVSVSKPIMNLLLIEKSMILLIMENVLIQLKISIYARKNSIN